MSGSSGIGNDISGGLGLITGGAMSLMGLPQVGLPMMMGGANGLLGGGGPAGGSGLSGIGSGISPIGTGGMGSFGAAPASFAPPVAPPPSVAPPTSMGSIGGPTVAGGAGTASPLGATTVTPATAATATTPTTGQLAMQDSAGVGNAYLSYLQQLNLQKYRPIYAPAHNSAVGAPIMNPLAPAGQAGIAPPTLTV